MFTLLDRYLAKFFLRSFFMALTILTSLFVLADVLNGLRKDYSMIHTFIMNLYQFPEFAIKMTPMATIAASLVTLSHFIRNSELIAMWGAGYSLRRVVANFLLISLGISFFTVVAYDQILPLLVKKRTQYYQVEVQGRPDYAQEFKKDRIWYRSQNKIYNIQLFDASNQTLLGLSLYHLTDFNRNFRVVQHIEARKATYLGEKKKNMWLLEDGTITVFDPEEGYPITQPFDSKEALLPDSPEDFNELENQAETLTLSGLSYFIEKNRRAGVRTAPYETRYHSRLAISFAPLLMALLGIPFAIRQKSRSHSMGRDLTLCFFVVIFYWLFYSLGRTLGSQGGLPPFLGAWLGNILFGLYGLYLLGQRKRVSSV
jgi:lipopolysaccharide export system permease protein